MSSMLDFKIEGVIFDVDQTLSETYPDGPGKGMHEGARLKAIHKVGLRLNNAKLQAATQEDSHAAFDKARESTVEAATWNMLLDAGVVSGELVRTHPLLEEVMDLKNNYYVQDLRLRGKPILDAERFVRGLALAGYGDHLAIASSGRGIDILTFLEMAGIADIIPASRVQSLETVENFKPHPEAYEKAFQSLELPESARAHTLAFEDDPRGIASAKAAGLYVCAITTDDVGKFSKADLQNLPVPPDLIAESWAEFSRLLDIPLAPMVAL